jgi:hypothetical protein
MDRVLTGGFEGTGFLGWVEDRWKSELMLKTDSERGVEE